MALCKVNISCDFHSDLMYVLNAFRSGYWNHAAIIVRHIQFIFRQKTCVNDEFCTDSGWRRNNGVPVNGSVFDGKVRLSWHDSSDRINKQSRNIRNAFDAPR